MTQKTGAEIGFVKLSDSDFVLEDQEQDIRGRDVHHTDGEHIGSVDDIYIDKRKRKMCFLEVGTGGFLGIGEKHLLIPVESVAEVTETRVTIEPGIGHAEGSPPFDTAVAPPTVDHPRDTYAGRDYTDPPGTGFPRDRYSGGGMGFWG